LKLSSCRPSLSFLVGAFASSLIPSFAAAQGFSPQEAVARMKVPDGFQVKLVASEPAIRQPVTMSFDDRGRLWVIQYLQYPTPAGLKVVEVDKYLRTKYDRIPEPPPRGPKGADRITILEDPDGNGHYRKAKDFVTGLNLASGMAIGHGGVFVVQPPYLLFYPDRNGDDVPDGDPEVLLTGFGMEDAHAFPNSLQWGPDGWLYGAQGSTVTAKIRGIEFQQGIWRYHPITKEFELFAEGGGNTWGVDFDRHGNLIAGTNWGGKAMLHQVQGGYYIKGFGKHGPLHNPYTFGYFDHVPYKDFKGGHVTCGGVLYTGGAFPDPFANVYIASNPLSNALHWHIMERDGSSFKAHHGGEFVIGNDTWFRPIDCLVGPDGALYVADWYDKRINHVDPVDNWDRTNGRIIKVEAKAGRTLAPVQFPLSKRTSRELVGLLEHPNDWYAREARRILAERRDKLIVPMLHQIIQENRGQLVLESLWALYVSGGFDEDLAETLLGHPNEDVRTWTIRFLGDAKKVSPAMRDRLIQVARSDASPTVRSQLACSCKRLPGPDCLPIVRELLRRDEDVNDPHIPLLLWWAIEDKAISDRSLVLNLLDSPEAWRVPLIRQTIVERLARRYMAPGGDENLATCAELLTRAPGAPEVELLLRGMEKALEGRNLSKVPATLEKPLAQLWKTQSSSLTLIRFGLRLGVPEAYDRALQLAADRKRAQADRIGLIEILGQIARPASVPTLLKLLAAAEPKTVRMATLSALQPFSDRQISDTVLALYPQMPADLRGRAQTLLCSRPASTLEFLQAVDAGRINPKEVPLDQLQRVAQLKNDTINRLVQKHWGKIGQETAGDKQARIRSLTSILRAAGPGDPARGKPLFAKHCATCHTLFGEGNKVGPDLTGVDRKNINFLLTNIVDPSAVIRQEFLAFVVATRDGRVLTGLIAEETPKALTLLDAKNERTLIARDQIDTLEASAVSLMPEKILDPLTNEELRDLFSYLQSDPPGAPGPATRNKEAAAPAASPPLKVCLVSGSLEYESDASLSAFQKYLESNYNVKCSRAFRKTDNDLPGLENLETCDVVLLFTRRLTIDGKQLEMVTKYCKAGKPIVGVRTASHAFQNWLQLDKEVFGGDYKNHYKAGPLCEVRIVEKAKEHPILAGVKPFKSVASLYRNPDLAKDVEVLLTGTIPEHTEPIAWTRLHNGGRVFYTSLGHPKDFQDENFQRLLANALFWTTQRKPEAKPAEKR
jgi:putative membrane-bound dehydrogenase-like protein